MGNKPKQPSKGRFFYKRQTYPRVTLPLSELVKLSDAELAKYDIAELHLICAQGLQKAEGLDIDDCLRKLDECADAVEQEIRDSEHIFDGRPQEFKHSRPHFACAVLTTVFHDTFQVKPWKDDLPEAEFFADSRHCFIHGLMNKQIGMCMAVTIGCVAVGRRLGYPLRLVRTMEHVYACWNGHGHRFNIEFAGEGFASKSEAWYLQEMCKPLTKKQAYALGYFDPLTPRQEFGHSVFHRGIFLAFSPRPKETAEAILCGYNLCPNDLLMANYIIRIMTVWRIMLMARTPPWFPKVEIKWSKKRRLPESIPWVVEQEYITLGIWESLLQDPRYRQDQLIASATTECQYFQFPKQIEVECE